MGTPALNCSGVHEVLATKADIRTCTKTLRNQFSASSIGFRGLANMSIRTCFGLAWSVPLSSGHIWLLLRNQSSTSMFTYSYISYLLSTELLVKVSTVCVVVTSYLLSMSRIATFAEKKTEDTRSASAMTIRTNP